MLEALNGLPEPQRSVALIEWEESVVFEKAHPLIRPVANAIGMTPEELDVEWPLAALL